MSVSMYDQLFKVNPSFLFLEPMVELNKVTMRIFGDAAKEQNKIFSELMRCHAEQIQQLTHAKRWDEMIEIQANWAANVSPALNELTQCMMNSCTDATSNYLKWLEGFQQENAMKESMRETMKEGKNLQEKTVSHHPKK